MTQWLRKKIIAIMGRVYVRLDKGLKHPTGSILGYKIDKDFEEMGRQQLCNHIEDRFGLPHDSFWALESTQKIRLGTQFARILKKEYTRPQVSALEEIEQVIDSLTGSKEEE